MRDKCQRCGVDGYFEVIILAGGFKANLCRECEMLWHGHISSSAACADAIRVSAEKNWIVALAVAKQPSTLEHYVELAEREEANDQKCFALAREFVKPITTEAKPTTGA